MNPEDPEVIKANVGKLLAAGASEQDVHDYIDAAGHPVATATPPAMPHAEEAADPEASYAQQALGGIASLARDIPGAEALQAGARAVFRTPAGRADLTRPEGRAQFGEGYKQSLSDIRQAEESAPSAVRNVNRVIGGTIAGAAMPGKSVVTQGARYGAFSGLLKSDPNAGVPDRLKSAAWEGTLGAVIPKVVQGVGTGVRTAAAKTLGKSALARKAATAAMDKVNYAKAAIEGDLAAANPTPAAVTNTMNETDIKPYIAEIKASRTMQGANPAAIVREAYKLMTERQRSLSSRIVNSTDYKAGSELERADIGAAKRQVLKAADQVMPSFRGAVYEHAGAERATDAFRAGADATKRIAGNGNGGAKNLEKKAPEAFMESIDQMSPEEARAALEGVLGRLKEVNLSVNPLSLFRAPRKVRTFSEMLPYIEALDAKAGNKTSSALGALGIGTTALAH